MRKLVKQQVLCLWLAMLAVLFGALAPTLSQAMAAPAQAGSEMQICTMAGMKTIVVDTAPADTAHFVKHCADCVLHTSAAFPPAANGFVFALPAPPSAWPPLYYQASAPLFPWTAASPRAPPSPC
jgi:hypothetical protein